MDGYAGWTPSGKLVYVQGSGIGGSSASVYANEFADYYGVKTIIRIGTCGAFQPDIQTKDIILAAAASCEFNANANDLDAMHFAPIADWNLLHAAYHAAEKMGIPVRVGGILETAHFYNNRKPDEWKLWASYGVLAVDMETAALYTLAVQKGFRALTILTVSDVVPTHVEISADEREHGLDDMIRIALEIV
jgi:purine-nucleoside phosphorylase